MSKSSSSSASSSADRQLLAGLSAFHHHHQSTYKSRWLTSLYPALLSAHPPVAVLNHHISGGDRAIESIRAALIARGAEVWHRGNDAEMECWKFPSQLADAAPTSTITPNTVDDDTVIEPSSSTVAHTRFLPPSPLDINVSPLLPYYLLDGASVLAVDALQVMPHHSVLDLCAAPGGKAVLICQKLDLQDKLIVGAGRGKGAAGNAASIAAAAASAARSKAMSTATFAVTQPLSMLHANEPQASRRIRLQTVLSEYIPSTIRKNRTRIEVTNWDATKIALPIGRYDRILVDAPCSSDRHVLSSGSELAMWSAKRVHSNAERQESLLMNALKAVKVGGIVVYATCSLSRRENDKVVANVLDKIAKSQLNQASRSQQRLHIQVLRIRLHSQRDADRRIAIERIMADAGTTSLAGVPSSMLANIDDDILYLPMGEPTKYGWMVLPDQVLHNTNDADRVNASIAIVDAPSSNADHDSSSSAVDVSSLSLSSSSSSSAASVPASAAAASAPVVPTGHGFGPLYFVRLKRISNVAAGEAEDSDEESSEEDEDDDDEDEDEEKDEDEAEDGEDEDEEAQEEEESKESK